MLSLDPESTALEAHTYELGFTLGTYRYYLNATHNSDGTTDYDLSRLLAGSTTPEDDPVRSGAAEFVASLEGTYNARAGRIDVRVDASLIGLAPGSRAAVTQMRAVTGAGVTAQRSGITESADNGGTNAPVVPYRNC